MNTSSDSNNRTTLSSLDTLINAGKSIEKVIKQENQQYDLYPLLPGNSSDSYVKPLITGSEEFVESARVEVPNILLQKLDDIKIHMSMGLLPEINRAWLSIDHSLYIWNYLYPNEIYEYKDQDQIIVGVGLVKPRADIFGSNINNLLMITTPLQVIPLALEVNTAELKVFATNMIVSSDDIQMLQIVGSDEGRIFMAGNDGNVYEFTYKHPEHWFGKNSRLEDKSSAMYMKLFPFMKSHPRNPVKSLAIDNERKCLYLLSDSSIELIYLGDPTNNYKSISNYTNIINDAMQLLRQQSRYYNADLLRLESLHVISKAESNRVHLMAMTAGGFRLYLTLYKEGMRVNSYLFNNPTNGKTPETLELGHIRLPPLAEATPASSQTYLECRKTYYDCGVCVTVKCFNEDEDAIHVTAAVPNVITPVVQPLQLQQAQRKLVETTSVSNSLERVYALTETNPQFKGKRALNELTLRLSDPSRQFIALTTKKLAFYDKLRPVHVLLHLLTREGKTAQEDQKDYELFFARYGQTESCAMCLSIICDAQDDNVVTKATNLFFEFGGKPTAAGSSQTPGNHLGQIVGQTGVTFSGKHEGFVLYFARAIAPIWDLKVFANSDFSRDSAAKVLYLQSQDHLLKTRGHLEKLKEFMDNNPRFHDSANISDPRFQAADRAQLELDLAEQKSVHELYLLLTQCIDAIHFIEFLLYAGFQRVLAQDTMLPIYTSDIRELDINKMLTTAAGRELSKELVIATISIHGASHAHANFDIVSGHLERNCKHFFDTKDLLFFKGMEYLRRAMVTETNADKSFSIKESLKYFREAADTISLKKMEAITNIYIENSYHVGAIELALERAQRIDPQNQALIAFETVSSRDETKIALLEGRMKSFDFALMALNDANKIRTGTIPANRPIIEVPEAFARNVFETAIRSSDKLFHYQFYSWLMNSGFQDELLTIETPFLIDYFQTYVTDKKCSLSFLSVYYRNRHLYMQSAACYLKLALSDQSVSLNDRCDWLSSAVINVKCASQEQHSDNPHFVAMLDQSITNCAFQKRVRDILRSQDDIEAQVAADELNVVLLNYEQLWEKYGKKFSVIQYIFQDVM